MNKRRVGRNAAAILLVGAGLYGFLCNSLADLYVSPSRRISERPEIGVAERLLPLLGKDTPAWVTSELAMGQGHPTVFVMVHGYGGSRTTWSEIITQLHRHHISGVAPCMPAHDSSPETTVGFGQKEARVVRDTVDWVRSQYPKDQQPKVVLVGISLGGSACWMAAAEGAPVDGVITEGAFARFEEAMNQFFDSRVPLGSKIFRPVIWLAKRRTGIDPALINPVEAAAKWKGKPALVIQAEKDQLVLRSHAERLSKAAGCPMWIVPNCGHAGCKAAAGDEYLSRLVAFAKSL